MVLSKDKDYRKEIQKTFEGSSRSKKLVIIIGIMTLNVTGKLFLVNWILCWRKQTSF